MTDPAYIGLPEDDGKVYINSKIYPAQTLDNKVWNSSNSATMIPHNYMANLSYVCGSARKFIAPDGRQLDDHNLTCKWDRTWTGATLLFPCDWVQCLRPTSPPPSVNLEINYWDGKPVEFGDRAQYVCKRGYQFENDPYQENVEYTCYGEKTDDVRKGFFDTPIREEDWPKCVEGNLYFFMI